MEKKNYHVNVNGFCFVMPYLGTLFKEQSLHQSLPT